jgi:hypothetical protein
MIVGIGVVGIAAAARGAVTIDVDAMYGEGAISPYLTGACLEDVNHEVYGGLYSQMIFGESFAEPGSSADDQTSGMWRMFSRGDARGRTELEKRDPFVGTQSQGIVMEGGSGEVGIENRGLNRMGMNFVEGREYRGHFWARAENTVAVGIGLASGNGDRVYASREVMVKGNEWRRYDFELTPEASDSTGRFEIFLSRPGSVELGYVFLEPGAWGTFKGLPVRGDIARGMIDEGITALRYGGSMVNTSEYRWMQMIGDRDRRPPYHGHWYEWSSNGWGIIDFLNFCEAAGFLPVVDLNIDETPGDVADFVEYVNGPTTSAWGARRAADGHPNPYRLTHIELGNEERVDETYWRKFAAIARRVWAINPEIVLTVGDFHYTKAIADPFHFDGADSGITSLAAHQKILGLAKEFGAEVWFDVHVWTGKNPDLGGVEPFVSYADAIDRLAVGAKHHVVIFELNADSHDLFRGLCNARMILDVERDGRMPFVSSANCLQMDGQNDNGWDQGLLFANQRQVWLQPPGYVWRMLSRAYKPSRLKYLVNGADGNFEAVATGDGKRVAVQIVNMGEGAVELKIRCAEIGNAKGESLSGAMDAVNTAVKPMDIAPRALDLIQKDSEVDCTIPARSFSIIRW